MTERAEAERAFARLPWRVQLGRLRQLARMALAVYDLPPARLTLLSHFSNTVFRVDTGPSDRYVLRIHRARATARASVEAELAWLVALRRDTRLEVPAPVPTRTGRWLTETAVPGVPTPHLCVLFRWLGGRRLEAGLTPVHLERVGALMAQLQDHAAHFGPPPGFARGRVDTLLDAARDRPDPFAPAEVAAALALVAQTLSVQEAALVEAVIARVIATQQVLGQTPATFGLIHADLHQHNLLFAPGTVRAIDFDDCGFGPLLYDLAVSLDNLPSVAAYPALRAGLLAGYRRVRPLSAAHEAYIDTFIALRRVQDALWVLDAHAHPAVLGDRAAQARRWLAPLPAFLAAGGHFPVRLPSG